jgi:spermidine synthase
MALGGVLAGVFNGVLAPHIFNQIYEYPIAMLLVIFLLPLPKFVRAAVLVVPVCIFCFFLQEHTVLLQERSFYAVNQVVNKQGVHVFMSQSTVHGLQDMQEKKPLNGYRAYYGALKPVIEAMKEQSPSLSVAIMGLGMGTMLCQFRPEDKIKAIEIDQQVIDIASNTKLFTYLRDCEASYEIIKNDGRLAMTQIPAASLDVLVLDAFNSDAIPIHLMTLEAFALYKSKLKSDGVLLLNLSNRHVRLLPVVTAVGRSLDLITFYVQHKGDAKLGQFDSEWALLTANEDLAFKIMNQSGWNFVAENQQLLWTDDYSNIIPLMKVMQGVG